MCSSGYACVLDTNVRARSCVDRVMSRGHVRQQIVPATSNGVDAVNFRSIRESQSLQLEGVAGQFVAAGAKSTSDGLGAVPDGEQDAFEGFSSMTLKYDGEEP